jgi:hypothetical protein
MQIYGRCSPDNKTISQISNFLISLLKYWGNLTSIPIPHHHPSSAFNLPPQTFYPILSAAEGVNLPITTV